LKKGPNEVPARNTVGNWREGKKKKEGGGFRNGRREWQGSYLSHVQKQKKGGGRRFALRSKREEGITELPGAYCLKGRRKRKKGGSAFSFHNTACWSLVVRRKGGRGEEDLSLT